MPVAFVPFVVTMPARRLCRWACSTLRIPPGPVAQRLEQSTHNRLVAGSNPAGPTKFASKLIQGNCAVKHKMATWTGYALLSVGPSYALTARAPPIHLSIPPSRPTSLAATPDCPAASSTLISSLPTSLELSTDRRSGPSLENVPIPASTPSLLTGRFQRASLIWARANQAASPQAARGAA